jgi:hypothetical protein
MENNIKYYGHALHMRVKRWHKRVLTWSPDGGVGEGDTKNKVEKGSGRNDEAEKSNN